MKARLSLLLVLALALAGCSGGITGTGDTTRISGKVLSESGQPLAGISVTVADSGDSASTDSGGAFEIVTELPDSSTDLIVEGAAFEGRVSVEQIPDEESLVEITIQVSSLDSSISIAAVSITIISPEDPAAASESDAGDAPGSVVRDPGSAGEDRNPAGDDEGLSHVLYRGKVKDQDGQALSGVTVAVIESADSDRSDSSGRFSIDTQDVDGKVTLRVSYKGKSGKVSISNIPSGKDLVVELEIVLTIAKSSDPDVVNVDGSFEASVHVTSIRDR